MILPNKEAGLCDEVRLHYNTDVLEGKAGTNTEEAKKLDGEQVDVVVSDGWGRDSFFEGSYFRSKVILPIGDVKGERIVQFLFGSARCLVEGV